jgi:hypothetical protein
MYPNEATYQQDEVEELLDIFRELLYFPSELHIQEIHEYVREMISYPKNF